MLSEAYNTIESVYAHYMNQRKVCLLQKEIDKVGIELPQKQELEVMIRTIEATGKPLPIRIYHPKFKLAGTLDDYHEGKAIIMIYAMERR